MMIKFKQELTFYIVLWSLNGKLKMMVTQEVKKVSTLYRYMLYHESLIDTGNPLRVNSALLLTIKAKVSSLLNIQGTIVSITSVNFPPQHKKTCQGNFTQNESDTYHKKQHE